MLSLHYTKTKSKVMKVLSALKKEDLKGYIDSMILTTENDGENILLDLNGFHIFICDTGELEYYMYDNDNDLFNSLSETYSDEDGVIRTDLVPEFLELINSKELVNLVAGMYFEANSKIGVQTVGL